MPDVPKPEDAAEREPRSGERMLPIMPEPVRRYYQRERPIEMRPVEYGRYLGQQVEGGRFHVWIRATGSCRTSRPSTNACSPMRPT